MERWHGKVAIITGASAGIGVATAKQLIEHGLIVVGLARRVDIMNDEMKSVKGPSQFYAKQCDVTSEQSVIEAFNWIKSTFKSVHILINNAGVMYRNKIIDSPTEIIESTIKVNVLGLLYCTKQAIKIMKESQTDAHIINVNAVLGHKIIPNRDCNVYPASKFAVTALSETLKDELNDSKIRVTSVSPGAVKTDIFYNMTKNIPEVKGYPVLNVQDVSSAIVYALGVPPHVEINEIIFQARAVK